MFSLGFTLACGVLGFRAEAWGLEVGVSVLGCGVQVRERSLHRDEDNLGPTLHLGFA